MAGGCVALILAAGLMLIWSGRAIEPMPADLAGFELEFCASRNVAVAKLDRCVSIRRPKQGDGSINWIEIDLPEFLPEPYQMRARWLMDDGRVGSWSEWSAPFGE